MTRRDMFAFALERLYMNEQAHCRAWNGEGDTMNMINGRPRFTSAIRNSLIPRQNTHARYIHDVEQSDELGSEVGDLQMEEDEAEEEYEYDEDQEFLHQRAQLDHKLKRKYESIFEKYERDFDGVGDVINLYTGQLEIDNGHLETMMDEKDSGRRSLKQGLNGRTFAVSDSHESEEGVEEEIMNSTASNSISGEEESNDLGALDGYDSEDQEQEGTEDDDGDELEDDGASDASMDDDDLILRGFTQAKRFIQAPSRRPQRSEIKPRPSVRISAFARHSQHNVQPYHADILEQFGPDIGPHIALYVAQQEQASRESHIEPAWRVPQLPEKAKYPPSSKLPPHSKLYEPSPSPEAEESLWALPSRKIGNRHGVSQDPSSRTTRVRNNFTPADDEAMLEYITKSQQKGEDIRSGLLWKALAAQVCYLRVS